MLFTNFKHVNTWFFSLQCSSKNVWYAVHSAFVYLIYISSYRDRMQTWHLFSVCLQKMEWFVLSENGTTSDASSCQNSSDSSFPK